MIRREIQLPNQPPHWLLISQMEHARLCGVLAEQCLPQFKETFRSELMRAIVHHDDGWSEWEMHPQLDPMHQRPYSFRELPLVDSLAIWKQSIKATVKHGVLSGWLVAKHFLALLDASESAEVPIAIEWRKEMIVCCKQWFDTWSAVNPEQHTREQADTGLAWLQLLDMMSLWLCSACPGTAEVAVQDRNSYLFAEGQLLETWCHFRQGKPSFVPWQFRQPMLEANAKGWIAPARQYYDLMELTATIVPHTIQWQIIKSD